MTGLANGVIFADFAPVVSVKEGKATVKRALSLRLNLWFAPTATRMVGRPLVRRIGRSDAYGNGRDARCPSATGKMSVLPVVTRRLLPSREGEVRAALQSFPPLRRCLWYNPRAWNG